MAISLTPELLKSQAGQMESLMNQYDSLFSGVTCTLNAVNGNWSENLSNNFAAKITSAQKSFSGILDTLQYGANAASASAASFEEIDTSLSKALGGGTIDLGSGTTGFGFGYGENYQNPISDSDEARFADVLGNGWESSQEAAQYISDKYDSLPKWTQELIEAVVKLVVGEDVYDQLQPIDKIKLILDICSEDSGDLASLNVDPGIISTLAKLIGIGSSEAKTYGAKLFGKFELGVIEEAYNVSLNSTGNMAELMDGIDYLKELAREEARNGDIAGGLFTCVEATGLYAYTLVYGSYEVATEAVADVFESAPEFVVSIVETAGNVIPGSAGEVISGFASGVNTVVDGIGGFIRGLF